MRRNLPILSLLVAVMSLSGCSRDKLTPYAEMKPALSMQEYFNGEIKAWGIVQDWRGEVVSRFDVVMVGRWEGDKGILEEDFTYYDGKTQRRIWHIEKTGDGTYTGRADDIIDKATGETRGNAMRWSYRMDLPVGDSTYRITFDDWMWQMNDGVLINRSYLKKFGFTVAELTLFMQKQTPAS